MSSTRRIKPRRAKAAALPPSGPRPRTRVTQASLLAGCLCLAASGSAQEALRMSLAGADAAAARRAAAESLGYYNLKVGPTGWRFGAGLRTEYTDNVNLTEDAAGADLIFSPQANTRMIWPVTDKNTLNLALGAGYSAYLQHSELDRAFVTPGSELAFDLYAGDFWFNLHDRFSLSQNSMQDPTVAGTGDYSQLQNAVGLSGAWDLNQMAIKTGFDHEDFQALSGTSGTQNGQAEVFSSSSGYRLRPELQAGLEAGGSLLSYAAHGTNGVAPHAVQWNVGSFADYQFSAHIHLETHVGYTRYLPDAGGAPGTQEPQGGPYGEAVVSHRLNEFLTYSLSGGRTVSAGFYGGSVDLEFVRWQAGWKLVRNLDLSTAFTYEHGTQFNFAFEQFARYGPGLNLGRGITRKLNASLSYQYYWRTSDLAGRDYTVNTVSLNLFYQF